MTTGEERSSAVNPRDEYRHDPPASAGPEWSETFLLDLADLAHGIGLSLGLSLHPHDGRAGFHASVVVADAGLVSLVDTAVALPRGSLLEIRAPGLWSEIGVQTPLDHVTADIEAFAVRLDDPADALGDAYGQRIALGYELEWETAGDIVAVGAGQGYAVPCVVHGELILGDEVVELDGHGWRSHTWGGPHPLGGGRGRRAGEWVHGVSLPNSGAGLAAPLPPGALASSVVDQQLTFDGDGHLWMRAGR